MQILESSPDWIPGIYKGEEVNVMYTMRLSGVINENGKIDRSWFLIKGQSHL